MRQTRGSSMVVCLLVSNAAAGVYDAEDLVVAHERGVSAATAARMVESVGEDARVGVYLLRRGLSSEVVRAMGVAAGEPELAVAAALGPLEAPSYRTVDTAVAGRLGASLDWAVRDEAAAIEPLTVSPQRRHLRAGRAGVALGSSLAAAGVAAFTAGWIGQTPIRPGETTSAPDPWLLGAGAVGFLGAAASFEVGAHQFSLAGRYPEGWTPPER